jgi:predicted transcriptional regulator
MIEKILGSRVKIKVLRFFFEYPLVKRNVREIAEECKIGFGMATNALRDLNSSGIVNMEKKWKRNNLFSKHEFNFFQPNKTTI